MMIVATNIYDAWSSLLDAVLERGQESAPRGMKIKELLGASIKVTDLRNNVIVHPQRDLNYRFMIAEWLWMLAGRDDVKTVARYNSQIAKFSDDGVTFAGAYGPRLAWQWEYIQQTLRLDPDSRQAVTTIWAPFPLPSKDIPCTIGAQFFIRQAKLHAIWTMRSNDLWLGTPYDFFNFSQLTNSLAADLGVEPGSLTLNVGSSHIYETNFEAARAVLNAQAAGSVVRSPRLKEPPYAGLILDSVDLLVTFKDSYFSTKADAGYARALGSAGKAQALEILRSMEND